MISVNLGILLAYLVENFVEETIGHLHNIILGETRDALATIGTGIFKGVAHYFFGARAGDKF